jgi:hypothetical protein
MAECLVLAAPNGHADPIERCPLLGEQRKTSALSEYFAFGPEPDMGNALATPKFMPEVMRDAYSMLVKARRTFAQS